jgi:hypothetical protein
MIITKIPTDAQRAHDSALTSDLVSGDTTATESSPGLYGAGDPESVQAAPPGTTYVNTTTGVSFIKRALTTAAGWIGINVFDVIYLHNQTTGKKTPIQIEGEDGAKSFVYGDDVDI